MSDNDTTDLDTIRGAAVLDRERRKRMQVENNQEAAEERFKQEIARAFKDDATLNALAKDIRDAVQRAERGESTIRKRQEGFAGLGVKPEDL